MTFEAANDPSDSLRYLVGADVKQLWRLRRWLGDQTQIRILRRLFKALIRRVNHAGVVVLLSILIRISVIRSATQAGSTPNRLIRRLK